MKSLATALMTVLRVQIRTERMLCKTVLYKTVPCKTHGPGG